LKKKLGYDDVRFKNSNCELRGENCFNEGYTKFHPEHVAFPVAEQDAWINAKSSPGNNNLDIDALVKKITDQVMAALKGSHA